MDLDRLPGIGRGKLPDFIPPQLATLVDVVPAGEEWLHEIKFDGYRVLCRNDGRTVRFFTREGKDWTARFGALGDAAGRLPVRQTLLDGEIVVMDEQGASHFQSLQEALGKNETARLIYYVFDLLHLDGYDLTAAPLLVRKEILARLLSTVNQTEAIRFSDHFMGAGEAFYRKACRLGLEGVISKRKNSPYRPGRSRAWLKIKCHASQEFVIGGFTDPSGSRTGLGAILLGVQSERDGMVYAGKVGTGFTRQSLDRLRSRLDRLATQSPPFSNPPVRSLRNGIHWVRPELVAEVEFTGWTRDGLLRHPSFKGLREDKPAGTIKRERTMPISSVNPRQSVEHARGDVKVAGIKLTNPDRLLYPEQGITKLELALYYEKIADWILPHLTGRPLTLVRCPRGHQKECFYQKHVAEKMPASVRRVAIKEKNSWGEYLVIDSLPGLIALVQLGTLELHTWGSRSDRIEYPDRLIFDLDPDPALPWKEVVRGAHTLRRKLADLGLIPFVKTTGGKGLHIVVPVTRKYDWEATKEFCRKVAASVTREEPKRYLATMSKAKRKGKIFIDYFRNGRGATAIAAYSTRARPGAPVSVPITWRELAAGIRPDQFTVRNLPARLSHRRRDPWREYESARRSITAAMEERLDASIERR
ncbi:MAG TPA: DNA ligase D [Candidatus Binatia bacterium]|jgi:bifunctional non-homologous end joining protein LigD